MSKGIHFFPIMSECPVQFFRCELCGEAVLEKWALWHATKHFTGKLQSNTSEGAGVPNQTD